MPETTKLIHQQLKNKRERRKERTNRLKLILILATAGIVLLILPVLLLGGSVGVSLFSSLQSIPDYQTAQNQYVQQAQPNPSQFYGRDAGGEPVALFQAPQLNSENGRWLAPDELSTASLNLVYAQWPQIFLDLDQANPTILARWFIPLQPADLSSPLHHAAAFARGGSLDNSGFGRLEADLIKDQIQTDWRPEELAAWHLNSSYFGNQIFGIQAAARFYFGRDAAQLTLPEAAMLIGIPQNPAINPIDDSAGAKLRQEEMLEALLRSEFITQEQFIAARFTPLDVDLTSFARQEDAVLKRFLNSRLEQYFSASDINNAGLNVITTLDPNLQADVHCLTDFYLNYLNGQGLTGDGECSAAVDMARSSLFPTGRFNQADSVLAIVLEPQTGKILALSGAGEVIRQPSGEPQQPGGKREAGGLFYPFVYLTALSQGHSMSSMVLDIADSESVAPTGAGPIFLKEALGSGSPAAVEHVLGWMGLGSAFKTITEMGAAPNLGQAGSYEPGEADVSFGFADLAHAYGVLANGGVRVGPQPFGKTQQSAIIGQVEDGRGDLLYEAGAPLERAILPDELTWLINQELNQESLPNGQTVARVTAAGQRNFDEWTIGYSPDVVVAVWAGNLKVDGERAAGSEAVTPALWQTIMAQASQDRPISTWSPPDNIVSLDVCWPSGLQPNGLCPVRQGLFVAGTEPALFDNMYRSFLVNSDNGNLATSSTPPNRVVPLTLQVFPPEAQNWAIFNGFELPPTEYDSIRTETETAGFSVLSPAAFGDVSQQTALQIELTEIDQFDYFRIAAYAGLSPGALQILAERIEPNRNLPNLDILLELPFTTDGLYTLLVTGFRPDGSIEELAVPVNADVTGPTFELVRPTGNSTLPAGEQMLFAQVSVENADDVERVEYFINDELRPNAVGTVSPFTGGVQLKELLDEEVDCFTLRAVAVDQQGNRSTLQVENICFG
ncbi:MAG: transglycosylase domain-containing protein [Anaerolineae bacterium]